jgi:hypothetical protein
MSEPFDLGEPSAGVRAAILAKTARVQRTRRIVRRAAVAAIVLVAYAAGFATPRPGSPVPANSAPRIEAVHPEATNPRALERRATLALSADERASLLRAAGDVEAALRCYRQFLKSSQTRDADAEPGDTWLLSALRRGQG